MALSWAGRAPETVDEPVARPSAMARVVPSVVATVNDQVSARLVVDTAHARVDDGVATVEGCGVATLGRGLTADPGAIAICRLAKDAQQEHDVRLSLPARAVGAFQGAAHLRRRLAEHRSPFTVLRLGTGGAVAVWSEERSGQTVWSIDYTTLGGANVLRQVWRLRNLRGCEQRAGISARVSAALGADPKALTIVADGIRRQPSNASLFVGGQRWAALRNDASGRTLLVAGRKGELSLFDSGQYGRVLGLGRQARLAPHATDEMLHFLVLADTWEQAQGYLALCDLEGEWT